MPRCRGGAAAQPGRAELREGLGDTAAASRRQNHPRLLPASPAASVVNSAAQRFRLVFWVSVVLFPLNSSVRSALESLHLVKPKSSSGASALPGSGRPSWDAMSWGETGSRACAACDPDLAQESPRHGARGVRRCKAGPPARRCQYQLASLTKPLGPWKGDATRASAQHRWQRQPTASAENKSPVYIAKNMYKYEYIFTCLFKRVVTRDIPVW